ncbi:N-acetyl-gamma-glutamyl-phosphate reductase [Pokkaliibacter plantistimulans]|uniref:N-acetyl-gamma-glutamyl-phosphate reductase n=1 Tax=Pokkaliibacter plantistimulans TaxID=1635171 RepID=A0ABX5LZL6_9GAMM|nr:N-acetyl-gamma-glutamyl-phosphate reductase [Pokkaliibacter plantistimulans]PXF30120.1 N-acetyl-gamma-glutamyl-phosphate reductase [Pokkaliibacter plantistimulans]
MKKVFIDGESGTTGLQVRQRLANHPHVQVVSIDPSEKRNIDAKKRLMSEVDVTILCLPDDASKESALLAGEVGCRVLDASSAHRIADGWVYGLPEIHPEQRSKIASAARVSNPGCYATGAIVLLQPLVKAGALAAEGLYTINAISGYTGGGKPMIERYESDEKVPTFAAYGLGFNHKHLPEIQTHSALAHQPIFIPSVGTFAQGMLVMIPLHLPKGQSSEALHKVLADAYAGEIFVKVNPYNEIDPANAPFITPHGVEGSNEVQISVYGNKEGDRSLLVAKLDNLGKGASGAAVQNLNIMLGLDESLCVNID